MYSKIRGYLLIVSMFYCAYANAAVTNTEREALISLYNQTSGPNWINKTGWLGRVGTECQWFGVSCLRNDSIVGVNLEKNGLKGTLPKQLESLSHLKVLDLSGNSISGAMPKELAKLSQLEVLDFGENLINGAIPQIFGKLSQLRTLTLSSNLLSQAIPRELGQLSKLEGLGLDLNKLSGAIPKEIGQLSHLKILDLDQNKLSGNIPSDFGRLISLQRLSLSNNQFTGVLPFGVSLLNKLDSLEVFNNCFAPGAFDLLPLQGTVTNLDIGDQNACLDDQSNNIPLIVTSENFDIFIPSIEVEGKLYQVTLARYENPLDINGWYWMLAKFTLLDKGEKIPNNPPVTYDPITSEVIFHKAHLSRQIVNATLYLYKNQLDTGRVYFQYTP